MAAYSRPCSSPASRDRQRFPAPGRRSVAAAAVALSLLLVGCRGERERGFDIPTEKYVSTTYGFSVDYPDTMDVREYIPDRVSIGFTAGDGFDARVEITVDTDSADSFDELMERKARDSCYADSPTTSLSCGTIQRRGRLRARSGERGEVLYLTLLVSEPGGVVVDSMLRGPYVGFELPDSSDLPTVLFIRAPMTRQLYETDVELVTNVARSLEIQD